MIVDPPGIGHTKSLTSRHQLTTLNNRQFNGTTYVTVIDTRTGQAIGSGPAAVPGKMQTNETPQITADGSHMFVTTQIERPTGHTRLTSR